MEKKRILATLGADPFFFLYKYILGLVYKNITRHICLMEKNKEITRVVLGIDEQGKPMRYAHLVIEGSNVEKAVETYVATLEDCEVFLVLMLTHSLGSSADFIVGSCIQFLTERRSK